MPATELLGPRQPWRIQVIAKFRTQKNKASMEEEREKAWVELRERYQTNVELLNRVSRAIRQVAMTHADTLHASFLSRCLSKSAQRKMRVAGFSWCSQSSKLFPTTSLRSGRSGERKCMQTMQISYIRSKFLHAWHTSMQADPSRRALCYVAGTSWSQSPRLCKKGSRIL